MKKKFKEEELNNLRENLKKGWVQKVGAEDGFAETWQVVQDAAHYSFNASHSLCVALDSLYGAYLKSHHPIEYFTVALTLYSGDMDRTAKLIKEMEYFKIKLEPIKFRHSISDYNMDKETNTIYKGVGSIKYMNETVANDLYSLRDNQYDSFTSFLNDFMGNSRQLEILIKLGYFSEFGKSLKLLKVSEIYAKYHGKKILKKDKLFFPEELVKKYAESETAKQFRLGIESMDLLIKDIEKMIPDTDIPLRSRLDAESEYLGYISYTNSKFENVGFVLDINTKYTPKIIAYMLDTGITKIVKVPKKLYQENPIVKGSILKMLTYMKHKSKLVDGEWIQSPDLEEWIKMYVIKQAEL